MAGIGSRRKRVFGWVGLGVTVVLSGCMNPALRPPFDRDSALTLASRHDVVIHRDTWGVPHVFGRTDADTAFGFAYAQAEDDWKTIEAVIPVYRGESALHEGRSGAVTDYLVRMLRIRESVDERFERDLSPATRRYLEAFADGLTYWAARHPDRVRRRILPITARDLVSAYAFQHLLFYGFDRELRKVTGNRLEESGVDRTEKEVVGSVSLSGIPVGSNAFAVAPGNTPDGATRLVINSHQPLTGPVAWYEAHLRSEEGLDMMGGAFPGSPTLGLGFNRNLAWGATVNRPDLVDVYRLVINPENPDQYRLDGRWVDFEKSTARIPVRLFPGFVWTFERELLRSLHGPVLRTEQGVFAIRYAGMGEIRQPEQWLRMSKSTTFEEWRSAMSMQSFASFNFVYADETGTIAFLHNSLTPVRKPGLDWRGVLPGDDSELIWTKTLDLTELPQVTNPPSGFVHSANQSPFHVSAPGSNPIEADYRIEQGFPTRMTNRAHRGLELFETLSPISRADMRTIKFDNAYSKRSRSYRYVASLFELEFDGRRDLQEARDLLIAWDGKTDFDNRAAALAVCILGAEWQAEQKGLEPPPAEGEFERCVAILREKVGRIDPPWSQVNRLVHADFDQPIQGGPDVLRAVYGIGLEEDVRLHDVGVDGLFYFVEWDATGTLRVEGIHPFGAATSLVDSPHHSDQSPLFVAEKTKDPWFVEGSLERNLERSYRPQDGD